MSSQTQELQEKQIRQGDSAVEEEVFVPFKASAGRGGGAASGGKLIPPHTKLLLPLSITCLSLS